MRRYLIQYGVEGACEFWNEQRQVSKNIDEVVAGGFVDVKKATYLRDLWNEYANGRCTFKVVAAETES